MSDTGDSGNEDDRQEATNGRSSDTSDGQSSGSGQSGSDQQDGGNQSSQQQGVSTAEKAVMVISIALTVLLFAYAGWQMATDPQANTPVVTVQDTDRLENGSLAVTVRLRNPKDVGLVTTTVQSQCTSPPTQVQFSYVPASSTRTGTLVCPANTTDPSVSISNWISR